MQKWAHEGERIDDLQFCNLHIIQNPKAFCFSMDAVLLADFASARPGDTIVDLGTGTGILPLLLCGRSERTTFHAFEIQKDMADMARRSVQLNGLDERITVYESDLRAAPKLLGHGFADLVVANPPYGREGTAMLNPSMEKRIARHEGESNLTDFVQTAGKLLKTRGRFAVVFPAQRMLELMDTLREAGIEPKRLRLVYPKPNRAPNLALLEGVKLGRPSLNVMPPLIVYTQEGDETEEIRRIYHR